MTPLARKIMKDSLRPKHKRQFDDKALVVPEFLNDCMFFEVTAIKDQIQDLHRDWVNKKKYPNHLIFLPSFNTVLEYTLENNEKIIVLCTRIGDDKIGFRMMDKERSVILASARFDSEMCVDIIAENRDISIDDIGLNHEIGRAAAALAIINTPKLVQQKNSPSSFRSSKANCQIERHGREVPSPRLDRNQIRL